MLHHFLIIWKQYKVKLVISVVYTAPTRCGFLVWFRPPSPARIMVWEICGAPTPPIFRDLLGLEVVMAIDDREAHLGLVLWLQVKAWLEVQYSIAEELRA